MNDQLILASGNPGKAREVESILAPYGLKVRLISELVQGFDVLEDGDTFEENATKKALEAHAAAHCWVLADDSGLCVEALDGGPGVRSARYAGEDATDADRNEHLLKQIGAIGGSRRAWFHCSLAAVLPASWLNVDGTAHLRQMGLGADARLVIAEGKLHGEIGYELRGPNGFGYDPLFLPDGFPGLTLAELDSVTKNQISHRATALAILANLLTRPL